MSMTANRVMTSVQYVEVAIGILLIYGAFFYEGSYNGVFGNQGRKPDYPPQMIERIVFFIGGILIVWFAFKS